jgi:DNA-binding response OmpR family regulator
VDDDPGIVDAIGTFLEYEGYQVSSSYSGNTILNMKESFPDLLLLDIWLSGSDGRDICKQLKQKDDTKEIPIIMISASRDIGPSALDAGADDFLAKPFDMDVLIQKINKYIQH